MYPYLGRVFRVAEEEGLVGTPSAGWASRVTILRPYELAPILGADETPMWYA